MKDYLKTMRQQATQQQLQEVTNADAAPASPPPSAQTSETATPATQTQNSNEIPKKNNGVLNLQSLNPSDKVKKILSDVQQEGPRLEGLKRAQYEGVTDDPKRALEITENFGKNRDESVRIVENFINNAKKTGGVLTNEEDADANRLKRNHDKRMMNNRIHVGENFANSGMEPHEVKETENEARTAGASHLNKTPSEALPDGARRITNIGQHPDKQSKLTFKPEVTTAEIPAETPSDNFLKKPTEIPMVPEDNSLDKGKFANPAFKATESSTAAIEAKNQNKSELAAALGGYKLNGVSGDGQHYCPSTTGGLSTIVQGGKVATTEISV